MKKYTFLFCISLLTIALKGQSPITYEEGKVSFISSRNVYVKFASTQNIQPGDTLFTRLEEVFIPALVVSNKSSSSTVCVPIGNTKVAVEAIVFAKFIAPPQVPISPPDTTITPPPVTRTTVDTVADDASSSPYKEKIRGRISIATYNTLSNTRNNMRMRYAFLFRGHHLNDSKLSIDSYITFRHTSGEWNKVQESIGNALKIFSLSASYEFNESSKLTFGRKINPRFSSVGAIDGVQYEHKFGNIQVGGILGSRPNFTNYGINLNLLQYGAYVSHIASKPGVYSQTTFGFIQQTNSGNTDRRFIYFQHSGEIVENLNLFSSFEVDLYENINNVINTSPRLTNMYLSLRYRFNKDFRVSVAYDNRRQIILYESFKTFIDQLIDDETRQGFRLGFVYRPHKNYTLSVNANTRFQQSKINASRNLNARLGIRKVPWLNARASLGANFLKTGYITSQVYDARLSKELVPNAFTAEIYYRWVNYAYTTSPSFIKQHIGGTSLVMTISKGLSFNIFYEGVFENRLPFHRVNARLIKRF